MMVPPPSSRGTDVGFDAKEVGRVVAILHFDEVLVDGYVGSSNPVRRLIGIEEIQIGSGGVSVGCVLPA